MKKSNSYIKYVLENNCGERESLIASAYLSGISLDDLNHLLEKKGFAYLYPRKKSDAIWKYIFLNNIPLEAADLLLSCLEKGS